MPEEKLYIGAKIIRAFHLDEISWLKTKNPEIDYSNRENRPGYCVIYPDGYKSWSPKETFENAYRLVTDGEKLLF